MKHTAKILLFIFLFFKSSLSVFAQDPQYSQFYAAPLYLAPSFAGATEGGRFIMNYRNQWPGIKSYETYAFSFDYNFDQVNSGFGLFFSKDVAGTGNLGTTYISLMYSYLIKINREWQFRAGLQYSYSKRSIDFDKLLFPDQLVSVDVTSGTLEAPSFESKSYLDFGTSGLIYSRHFWFGATIDHLTKPDQSLTTNISRVPIKISFFTGKKINLSTKYKIRKENLFLSALYKSQDKYDQLDFGAYWSKDIFVAGLLYRGIPFIKSYNGRTVNNDALVFVTGVQKDNIKIGYSYDFTISKLFVSSAGAHEISLEYTFDKKAKKRKPEIVPCSKF